MHFLNIFSNLIFINFLLNDIIWVNLNVNTFEKVFEPLCNQRVNNMHMIIYEYILIDTKGALNLFDSYECNDKDTFR